MQLTCKCVNRIGFLSNGEEGQYLNSEEGQNSMAESIASIIAYRKEYSASGSDETYEEKQPKKILDHDAKDTSKPVKNKFW
jgi:N-acetylmuramoyl-L-alanine amidase